MPRFVALPVLLDQIRSTKDKALKITFISPELPPDQASIILALANAQGYAYFAPNALQEADLVLPKDEDMPQTKTPSQRLRARMFVYFTQHLGKPKQEFSVWYDQQLDKIGDGYLERMQT